MKLSIIISYLYFSNTRLTYFFVDIHTLWNLLTTPGTQANKLTCTISTKKLRSNENSLSVRNTLRSVMMMLSNSIYPISMRPDTLRLRLQNLWITSLLELQVLILIHFACFSIPIVLTCMLRTNNLGSQRSTPTLMNSLLNLLELIIWLGIRKFSSHLPLCMPDHQHA